jgi:hypothetical protein
MFSLNLLLSSSNFPIFFLRQSFLFDLLEKTLTSDFRHFYAYFIKSNLPFVKVKFELTLPFSNDLSKFRNKVLVLLYYFVFELLVGFSPMVVPVGFKNDSQNLYIKFNKKNLNRKERLNSLANTNKIDKFVFYRDLRFSQSSVFLTFITCFLSKHSYLDYTVPSKLLKVNISKKSCQFFLNPGLSSLDFLSQFDDFILSRVLLSFSFAKSNFFLLKQFDYLLSSLGLNLFKLSRIVVNNKKFLFDSTERNQNCFYHGNRLFLIPSLIN